MINKIAAALLVLAVVFTPGFSVLAEENEEERTELTLEESVKRALSTSFQVRSADLRSEKAYILRQRAVEDQDNMDPIIPWLDYLASMNVAQKDLEWRMTLQEKELLEERIEYDTMQVYYQVLRKEAAQGLTELVVEHAKKGVKRAAAMYRVGILSSQEYKRAQLELENALAGLQVQEQELEGAYQRFNRIVGLPLAERPLMVDLPEWSLLRDLDIDIYVARVVEGSTAIWLAEQRVELARFDRKMHVDYDTLAEVPPGAIGSGEPYEAKEMNVTMARYEYYDTKRQLEFSTRSIYRTIKTMEQEYERLSNRLAELEILRQAQQARLEVGMITPFDLLELEVNQDQLQMQQKELEIENLLLQYALRRPWVLDGGGR